MSYLEQFLKQEKNILITGGAGFIGGALIRKLIRTSKFNIYNLDKIGYASDLDSINQLLNEKNTETKKRYNFLNVNINNYFDLQKAIETSQPDIIMHLAAESSVDKSIQSPFGFIETNIVGTFNILDLANKYYQNLEFKKKENFLFHHISTDEVFGSLGKYGKFSEDTNYSPRSPYSSSKASSDHLVMAWHHTYGLPVIISNCSNNYGPWQFPEKLIPVIISKAINNEKIPIYGDGKNIRDWLFVEDHVDALLHLIAKAEIGENYCIGGNSEKSNIEVAKNICSYLDQCRPLNKPHENLLEFVPDRKGHDDRYAIDMKKIKNKLNWEPVFTFPKAIEITIKWYLNNIPWLNSKLKNN